MCCSSRSLEHLALPGQCRKVFPVPAHEDRPLFLGHLKERFEPLSREFSTRYGDEKFGSFRIGTEGETEKRGVLMVAVKRGLDYVADSFLSPSISLLTTGLGESGRMIACFRVILPGPWSMPSSATTRKRLGCISMQRIRMQTGTCLRRLWKP